MTETISSRLGISGQRLADLQRELDAILDGKPFVVDVLTHILDSWRYTVAEKVFLAYAVGCHTTNPPIMRSRVPGGRLLVQGTN